MRVCGECVVAFGSRVGMSARVKVPGWMAFKYQSTLVVVGAGVVELVTASKTRGSPAPTATGVDPMQDNVAASTSADIAARMENTRATMVMLAFSEN